jgi:hypothetical protein
LLRRVGLAILTVVAVVVGIFQVVADMAFPAVAADAAIQAEAAVDTVRQDIRVAAVRTAGKAFPAAGATAGRAFPVEAEVTADRVFPAAAAIMVEADIMVAMETATGEGMDVVM